MRSLKTDRVVVKIGTNTLSRENGGLNYGLIEDIAGQICELKRGGRQFIVVTSGAIGLGCNELSLSQRPSEIVMRQVCAAIGQSKVMEAYHRAFEHYGGIVAQILLTYDDFRDETKYKNLRNGINELLRLNVTPIINENDVVATDEIGDTFGDNDKLSAMVAVAMNADLLIILTDVDGLYNANPRNEGDVRLIRTVREITPEIEKMADMTASKLAVGGMKTKINAAKICMEAGCNLVIANGKETNVIRRIVEGDEIGTLFSVDET
ncbi:MAG: glutamate 5-kinase [Candidatus Syntrophoarchaeum sp. WYZ-LMO15]|nr:MAG: glutamate 5-kinase [Candidatus Syntrophoarchaeum sp. WYZ-LMO15]